MSQMLTSRTLGLLSLSCQTAARTSTGEAGPPIDRLVGGVEARSVCATGSVQVTRGIATGATADHHLAGVRAGIDLRLGPDAADQQLVLRPQRREEPEVLLRRLQVVVWALFAVGLDARRVQRLVTLNAARQAAIIDVVAVVAGVGVAVGAVASVGLFSMRLFICTEQSSSSVMKMTASTELGRRKPAFSGR